MRGVVAVDDAKPVASTKTGAIDARLFRVEDLGGAFQKDLDVSRIACMGTEQLDEVMRVRRVFQPFFGFRNAFGERRQRIIDSARRCLGCWRYGGG